MEGRVAELEGYNQRLAANLHRATVENVKFQKKIEAYENIAGQVALLFKQTNRSSQTLVLDPRNMDLFVVTI